MGLVGAGVAGYIMSRYKTYGFMLKFYAGACTICIIILTCILYSNNLYAILILFGAVGFFLLPLLPISMENAAETVS